MFALLVALRPLKEVSWVLQMRYQRALVGDVFAARELLDRALGKPKVTLEQKQALPLPEGLLGRLAALVQANPALPDRLAAMGCKRRLGQDPASGAREPLRGV